MQISYFTHIIYKKVVVSIMMDIKERPPVRRRTKGEKTRKHILQAAIKVLATNGIKGTTHRAVASEADIQLSLTTYYFKDIQELIHEAFLLSCVEKEDGTLSAWNRAFKIVESYSQEELKQPEIRREITEELSNLTSEYLYYKIINCPIDLAVEQLLFTTSQVTPQLRCVANDHKKTLMEPFITLCSYFNQKNPEVDADILATMFCQLEYRNLCIHPAEVKLQEIKSVVHRLIGNLVGLNCPA